MDVFEAVRTMLAVREYDFRPVPPDVSTASSKRLI